MEPLIEAQQHNHRSAEESAAQLRGPVVDDPVKALEHYHRYLYASRFVRSKKVMEISCGEGYGTAFLSINAEEVVGVDSDEAAVARAKEKYKEFTRARFVAARIEDYALSEPRYDVVVSFGTLERLDTEARHRFVENIKKSLKHGGILVISAAISDGRLEDIGDRGESRMPEFSAVKFSEFLKQHFQSAIFLGQKPVTVSSLWSLYQWQDDVFRFHTRDNLFTLPPEDEQFAVPHSLVAVCSTQPLPREIADNSKSVYYDIAQVKRTQEIVLRSRRLESEVETLRESVTGLLKDEAQRTDLLIRLQRENGEYREDLNEKASLLEEREARLTMLENDLGHAHAANDTLQQAYELRSARANTLKEEHSALTARVQEQQAALQERDSHIEKLAAECEQYRGTLLSVQEELNDRTAQVTQERGALERARLHLSELSEQVQDQSSLAAARGDEIRKQEMQIAELRSHESDRDAALISATDDLQKMNEAVRVLELDLHATLQAKEESALDADELRTRVAELEDQVRQQTVAIEFERGENMQLKESIDALRRQIEDGAAALEERRQLLVRKEEEVNELFRLGDETMADAERLKSEYGGREQEISILQGRLNEQTAMSAKRFEEIERLRAELAGLHLRINEKSGIAELAKKELEASREQMTHLHREGSDRVQKIAHLEHSIQEQKEFLANLQREYEEQALAARQFKSELDRQVTAFDTYQKSQSDLQQRYAKSQIKVQEMQAWGTMLDQKLSGIYSSKAYKLFSSLGAFPNENG